MFKKIITKGRQFIKSNWKKCTFGIILILVLAFLFWYGGDGENARGWKIQKDQDKEIQVNNTSQKVQSQSDTTEINTEAQNETQDKAQDKTQDETQTSIQTNETENLENQTTLVNDIDTEDQNQQGVDDSIENKDDSTLQQEHQPSCTISISCATILNNMDKLKSNKKELIPQDGWILKPTQVEISEGESAFKVLQRVTRQLDIPMETSKTSIYDSYYIEGIYNIYEFDCGSLSGWLFFVNDQVKNMSSSEITVKNGDEVRWVYTCNLGKDVQ